MLNKKLKYSQQTKHKVHDVVNECELIFPQYSGDASNLIKLWLWKIQATAVSFHVFFLDYLIVLGGVCILD